MVFTSLLSLFMLAGLVATCRATLNDLRARRWAWAAVDVAGVLATLSGATLLAGVYSFMPSGL